MNHPKHHGKSQHKPQKTVGDRYFIYGQHACEAALANPARKCFRLICTRAVAERYQNEDLSCPVEVREAKDMDQMLPKDAVHQGLALEVAKLETADLGELMDSGKPLVMLDQVTDPHNVGAILRSAAAFDAGGVILPKDHAPQEGAAMAKAASGALDIVPMCVVVNLAQTLRELKENGYWAAGLDGEAKQTIAEAKLGAKTVLVMGAEGAGLRRLTREMCDFLVKLPMSERMESLNVSNAAAIALYDLYIKR